MSALSSSIKVNLKSLYNNKNEFDWLMSQKEIPIRKVDRMFKLKKEMLYSLSCILSANSEEVLANSFNLSVNAVEQGIVDLIGSKKKELEEIQVPHNKVLDEVSTALSKLYLLEVLENGVHILPQSEDKLIELKNTYLVIHDSNQKIIALNYILSILESYKVGFAYLLDMISNRKLKEDLSFEEKQEIYKIFLSVSLEINKNKIRNKVYSENKEDERYNPNTYDYLCFYENLILDLARSCKLYIPSFYLKIKDEIINEDIDITSSYIQSRVDFIYNKYSYDIEDDISKLQDLQIKKHEKMQNIILDIIGYDLSLNVNRLTKSIKENECLPEYIKDLSESKTIYYAISNTDILIDERKEAKKVLNELSSLILEKFDGKEYIKGYRYNQNNVIKQIAHFRHYFISLLESSKNDLINKYKEELNKSLVKSSIKKYNLKANNEKINNLNLKIRTLENAIKYINQNFREFSKKNFKIYLDAIERRYYVQDLYETLEKNKLKRSYKSKATKLIEREREYLNSFVSKETMKEDLINEILDNCILDDEMLKQEVLEII